MTEQRHLHVPAEPIRTETLDANEWTYWRCACGVELMPRNDKGRLAPPSVLDRLGVTYGYEPEAVHADLPTATQ